MPKLILFIFFLNLAIPLIAQVQDRPSGLPFSREFSPKSYGGEAQNWNIVEDQNGLLYVANTGGIMEYDGVRWRMIDFGDGASPLALGVGPDNVIYAGGTSEIGKLVPDSTGTLVYQSLKSLIPEPYRDIRYVRDLHVIGKAVVFHEESHLLILEADSIRVLKPPAQADQFSFVIENELYINISGLGLHCLNGDQFRPVPGGSAFASFQISMIQPIEPQKWLIGTWYNGLFVFNGDSLLAVEGAVSQYFQEKLLYRFCLLPDGMLAGATYQGGLLIFSPKAEWIKLLTRETGLNSETVLCLHASTATGLWAGSENGLAQVEYPSPFSWFGEVHGLDGTVNCIYPVNGVLSVGTNRGIMDLNPVGLPGSLPQFTKWPSSGIDIFAFHPFGEDVISGEQEGLFLQNRNTKKYIRPDRAQFIYPSRRYPGLIFTGNQIGISYIRHEGDRIIESGILEGIQSEVRSLGEDAEGYLWAGCLYDGIKRIDIREGFTDPEIRSFGLADGLSHETDCEVLSVDGRLIFSTMKSLYRFDDHADRFIPDSSLGKRFADGSHWVYRLVQDTINRNIWMHSYNVKETLCLKPDSGSSYSILERPFKRLNDFNFYAIYPEPDGTVWFGGPDGLIRYDPQEAAAGITSFSALVRSILIAGDSLLYGGASGAGQKAALLPYRFNSLRFESGSTWLLQSDKNEYRYRLEGYEPDWSNWTQEPYRIYTNLPEGYFTFRVETRNNMGDKGLPASWSFEIQPPWYRTWPFLLISGILLLGSLILLVRYFATRKLVSRVEELEMRERLQKERERISRDLHDNVGAQLTAIISNLDVIAHKGRTEPFEYVENRLETMGESARETMDMLRETIWAIKKEGYSLEEFGLKVREYLSRYFQRVESGLKWHVEISGDPAIQLGPAQALNLFRIQQEAVQNVVKHAEAQTLGVSIEGNRKRICLRVSDDGKGMHPKKNVSAQGHYGLENMRQRSEEIGGEFRILKGDAGGTVVEVVVQWG